MDSGFGPHLVVDIKGCKPGTLSDLNLMFKILDELPELIGMTKITTPYVFPYSGLVPEDKGITGIVIIAESHLTLHSFQEKDYLFFDIFSCKPFDTDKVISYLQEKFEPQNMTINITERGKDFPR